MWDTPEHARIFLKWTEAALAVASEPDGADADAVREGLDSADREPKIAVNAALSRHRERKVSREVWWQGTVCG